MSKMIEDFGRKNHYLKKPLTGQGVSVIIPSMGSLHKNYDKNSSVERKSPTKKLVNTVYPALRQSSRGRVFCCKESGSISNRLSPQFKIYVLMIIAKTREIKCEECGEYKNVELHHTKYSPKNIVSIKDIKLLCCKHHRNAKSSLSKVSTVFKNGKRFCVGYNFKFAY